ncbi:MAG: sodium/solute symporter [Phycisphaerales bacterium]|nr:MAG: sodium/solute symporter [Phycisphaerales bacterium]
MDFRLNIGLYDLLIVVAYLAAMVFLGCWVGLRQRKKAVGSGYFLASKSLLWPWIGLSLFSTNISTIELVSMAEEGYKRGLVYGNLEWMAALTLIVLALFFAPFYIRSNVSTLPGFLLKRYDNRCRVFEVVIAIFSAIFIHTGFALFAGAKVMEGLFNMPIMTSMTIILLLTGLYTIVGGLKAVVLTDSLATVVLISGSIIMTAIGFHRVGGWEGLTASVEPARLHMLRSAKDVPDMSWYSVFLGYPIIGIWYFCTDQTIVQRVLGAKDVKHAQLGPIFAGFIKILPVFIFVMPGLICYALIRNGALPDKLEDSATTYAYLIAHILPAGLQGVVAAAMLAALMSTLSSALNSIATVFCYDIYKPLRPETSDRTLVRVGRITTLVAMLLAILWAPRIARFESILEGNTMMICYVAPSITAVFLAGVLWKRASAKGAFLTLCAGTAMGAVVFILDFVLGKWNYSFMMTGFWLFVLCSVILVVTSLVYPHKHTRESERLTWANPLEAIRTPGWRGLANYKFLSLLLLAVMALLYIIFD